MHRDVHETAVTPGAIEAAGGDRKSADAGGDLLLIDPAGEAPAAGSALPGGPPEWPWATATPGQAGHDAVTTPGPILVAGVAGSGVTSALAARAVRLVDAGNAPEAVLVLASSDATAAALRARLRLATASRAADAQERTLRVMTVPQVCEELLRGYADQAHLDPFFVRATSADRVHLMMVHARERHHAAPTRSAVAAQPPPLTAAATARILDRIDWLKSEQVSAERYAAAVSGAGPQDAAPCGADPDLAVSYTRHEALLQDCDALDDGNLLSTAQRLLSGDPAVRTAIGRTYRALVVDDFRRSSPAWVAVVGLLASTIRDFAIGGYPEELAAFATSSAGVRTLTLPGGERPRGTAMRAATAGLHAGVRVAPKRAVLDRPTARRSTADQPRADEVAELAFWEFADEAQQARAVLDAVERFRRVAPRATVAVLVRSVDRDARALVSECKSRAVAYRVHGGGELFAAAEARDLVAWIRLVGDPLDTAAVVRLLTRPPTELRPVELAKVLQIARRRKLDVVSALPLALESAELPPEAHERIGAFLAVYGDTVGEIEQMPPQQLVHHLAERTGLRRAALGDLRSPRVGATGAEALAALGSIERLAAHFAQLRPRAGARELGAYVTAAIAAGLPVVESADVLSGFSADDCGDGADGGPVVHVAGVDAVAGAQFDHVFVLGLADGAAAGEEPAAAVTDALGAGLTLGLLPDPSARSWQDERRRVYVSLTRASATVTVCRAVTGPGTAEGGSASGPLEAARAAVERSWETPQHVSPDDDDALHARVRVLRESVLQDVGLIGARLGELRLDTDRDIAAGVARYLELVKVAALIQRPKGQPLAEALQDVNARLAAAATPLQRELFAASPLDDLLAAESPTAMDAAVRAPEEPRLAALLPTRGAGVIMSASDIETYRACPLRYRFGRVLRIPTDPTPQQRFGIMMHKVLERYHSVPARDPVQTPGGPDRSARPDGQAASANGSLASLLGLLDSAWRRAGFGGAPGELALLDKARAALTAYHAQLAGAKGRPVWFERSFTFAVGDNVIRGRVDRVDQLPDGDYELIDYKTGYPKTEAELESDIQLSLYALAAERAWHIRASRLAYYYVLDNRKATLARPGGGDNGHPIAAVVAEVGAGIAAMQFEPKPSHATCSRCDFLGVCPVAEA
jgi:DNA helicase-2/ATP-dependent DNA helicase PcrA